jgi:hypothetical protein
MKNLKKLSRENLKTIKGGEFSSPVRGCGGNQALCYDECGNCTRNCAYYLGAACPGGGN